MGVTLEDRAIHKGARVALVGVTDNVFDIAWSPTGELPLEAGQKAGTASPAQPRTLDLLDDVVGGHGGQHLGEPLIAPASDVFTNIFRIDDATVPQSDAQLLTIEGNIFIIGDGLMALGLFVGQPLDDFILQDGLFDDLGRICRPHIAIKDPFGIDGDDGAHRAEPSAPRFSNTNLLLQTSARYLLTQGLHNVQSASSHALAARAD